jgi:ribulose-phosphate 3-epimerase
MKLSVSILSIKDDIKKNINIIDNSNVDFIHLDIMDSIFVANKTWDFNYIFELVKDVHKPLDVHLMVSDVISYIDDYKKLNPIYITFHLEAVNNHLEIIDYIKKHNIKVGMSIKPNTPISLIKPYLKYLDLVLIMSVEPGMGGQLFLDNATNKIDELKDLRESNNYNYVIEVDGGINDKTVEKCINANIVVVGSYITNSSNYIEQINKIKK